MYRVLIVEDIIRKGIAYTMDWVSMGCTIIGEAANGREGVEKIQELKPDIVLADIMMPVMDGIEMIRKGQEIADFKAIIMTSYADFEYAKKAIDLGVSAYLMKPVDGEELKKSVETCLADDFASFSGTDGDNAWRLGMVPNEQQIRSALLRLKNVEYIRNLYISMYVSGAGRLKEIDSDTVSQYSYILPQNGDHDITVTVE